MATRLAQRTARCLLLLAVLATASAMHTQKERYLDKSEAVLLRGAGTASASAAPRSLLHFWAGAPADMQHRPPLFSSRRMLLDRTLQAAQGADRTDAANAPSAADQRSRPQPRPSYGPYGNTYPTQGGGSSLGNSNSGSSAWQNAASGSSWGGGWGRRR